MTITTHDLQMESYTEPYRAPEPQKPSEADAPKEDTKSAIARLREEIRIATSELELSEASLAKAKCVLSGTTN